MQPDGDGAQAGVGNKAAKAGSGVISNTLSAHSSGLPVIKSGSKGKLAGVFFLLVLSFGLGIMFGSGRGLTFGANGLKTAGNLDYSSVDQVYDVLHGDYDGTLRQEDLLAGLKKGLTEAAGDPYTEYFTASEAKSFNEQLDGNFTGIGAELGQDDAKNLIVIAPISGTPAERAGVKPQDIIAEIDGKATTGLSVEEAVSKIRGEKGTEVKLILIRNKSETIPLTITRDTIVIPRVTSKTLDGNIGYMRIATFSDSAASEAAKAADELHDKGVKGMILDLRGNPGGRVDTAEAVASLWLPRGKMIMQEKRGNTVIKTYTASGNGVFEGMPTVVLIDDGSASASEIVAGALLDNKAATLIGAKSYGKGSVQELRDLSDDGLLKVTVARWYRPNGQNIDKKGIEPTQKVEISDDDAKAGKDPQLEAAQAKLR